VFLLPEQQRRYLNDRLAVLGFESLLEYIDSPIWSARRSRYYREHAYRCRKCSATTGLNLHHETYQRLGEELDSDLMPLCEKKCHPRTHEKWTRAARKE
jgi:hypothetical protein